MTESDMRIIDQIADRLGLSRSELVRQAIVDFAKSKGVVAEYTSIKGTPPGAVEWILAKSHGPFGDFKMPVFTRLITEHGLMGKFPDDKLPLVLKRYKEHVSYWSTDDSIVRKELADFSNATKIPLTKVLEAFYAS
jgi:hypothetical protein